MVLQEPFATRWLLDVELLARLMQARRGTPLPSVEQGIYEYVLDAWQEVPGSKVTPWDFVAGLGGLARLWWHARRERRPFHHAQFCGHTQRDVVFGWYHTRQEAL